MGEGELFKGFQLFGHIYDRVKPQVLLQVLYLLHALHILHHLVAGLADEVRLPLQRGQACQSQVALLSLDKGLELIVLLK